MHHTKWGARPWLLVRFKGVRGAWPSPHPETDTLKGSRATGTQHSCGKEVPLHEQDGPSHLGPSRTSRPHPGASRSTSGLSPWGLEQGTVAGRQTLRPWRCRPWEPVWSPGLPVRSRAGQTVGRWRGAEGGQPRWLHSRHSRGWKPPAQLPLATSW